MIIVYLTQISIMCNSILLLYFQVFDRMQPLGICLSNHQFVSILDDIGAHFNSTLIDSIKNGNRFRLVGDNVNTTIDVRHERKLKHRHMKHWFASAALVQHLDFNHLPAKSQQNLKLMPVHDLLPTPADYESLKTDYAVLCARVAAELVPAFSGIKEAVVALETSQRGVQQTTKLLLCHCQYCRTTSSRMMTL
jgi:hypothetical protein